MGILPEDLDWFLSHAHPPGSILELGNQFLYASTISAAKPFFTGRGFDHVSIDLNGQDGALPIDLAKPFDLGRTFDYITDFGTSEHVPNLHRCLANLHHHAHIGTVFFHVNPLTGNWPGHGFWYRDEEFYSAFAKLTGYRLAELSRRFACGNSTDGWNICARMEKISNAPFLSEGEWDKLPVKRK